jgi:hypothetical protein
MKQIGNGNAAKAWSIVGSLTRTVEYSQLTVEHEESDRQPLCQPVSSLPPAKDWAELEERRRVFWNTFNLDRFCSSAMGWNTSLTSDDVRRRLPCDGIYWRKQEAVVTPYLGIWDKSAGRIGNPIASISSPYQLSDQANHEADAQTEPGSACSTNAPGALDMSRVGAFAYCVEATESLSRVTSYFLQQRFNIHDPNEINSWLTRFKELDLRLVHWKMLLPHKWKSNLARQATRMDPNLTLAHITHNAFMILLHQVIAYPPSSWPFRRRLPSVCSAETCCSAGGEIATIAQNYLRHTPEPLPVTSQFAFCVYIAARVFLVHWRYDADGQLLEEFWSLTQSLKEMSRRWVRNSQSTTTQQYDLAAKFANKLEQLYGLCSRDEHYRINVADYTHEIDHQSSYGQELRPNSLDLAPQAQALVNLQQGQKEVTFGQWPNNSSATPERPSSVNMSTPTPRQQSRVALLNNSPSTGRDQGLLGHAPQNTTSMGEFNASLPTLLDQNFMDMDRVIAFDDGSMFTADCEVRGW